MKNKPSRALTLLLPTLADIIWIGTFILVILSGNSIMNQDGDLGMHLTTGNYILEHKSIPLYDIFSNSMTGQPATQHEWLSAIIFALSYRILGFSGVLLVSGILIATTILLTFKQIHSQGSLLLTSIFIILLTIFITKLHWLPRPHLFTLLIFTVWVTILRKMQRGDIKVWWILPLLMLLWANLHGGFLMGLVSWLIFVFGIIWDSWINKTSIANAKAPYFWRYYILGGVSSLLVTLINPSGFGIWRTVLGFLGNKYLTNMIIEYLSPNFHDPSFWPVLLFIGIMIYVFSSSKKEIRSGELFHTIAWLVFGLYSGRNLPLFAIAASPLVALGLDDLLIKTRNNKKVKKNFLRKETRLPRLEHHFFGSVWPVFILLVTIGGFSINLWQSLGLASFTFDPDIFPVEAVNWLKENPQDGKMLNKYGWGGYLLFRMWPEEQVFIDGKTDFYGEEFVREYVEIMALDEGWETIIGKYDLKWAILPPNTRSAIALESNLGWRPIYTDATAVILVEN